MRKLLLCFILMFLIGEASWAQLSDAPFSFTTGTYTEITGGTVLGNTATNDQVFVDPALPLGATTNAQGLKGPGFPIGFNFTFDGTVYDRFAVNANGWISLGLSALGSNAVWIVASPAPLSQVAANITPPELVARISGLGCNLAGQTGSVLRIETVGSAPNRECVIQWKGYKVSGQNGENINFQIRLIETTNQVRFIYGQVVKSATNAYAQVGLRDKPATMSINFVNRSLVPNSGNWTTTVPGTSPGSYCVLSATTYPASGLTFTYGPVPACTGTPNPGNTITTASLLCPGANFTLTLQNFTSGYNVTYQWQSSLTGGDPWINVTNPPQPQFAQIVLNETESNYYRCQVTCSGNTTASNPVYVAVNTWLYCGFCAPVYTGPPPYYGPYVFDNVVLVTLYPLLQETGENVANDYYKQYVYTQNAIPDVSKGKTFYLDMTFNTDSAQYFGVWVDFDHSSAFEADEYFSTGTNAGAGGFVSLPIAVPSDAIMGTTRLRIRGGDQVPLSPNQACGTTNSITGCAQDYFINVVEPSTLNGHVYDSDGNPIIGATIECTERGSTTTDGSGYYSFQIPSGAMQIKCSKTGYNTVTITPTIPVQSTVTQDFTLANPNMEVGPGSLLLALGPTELGNSSLTISNEGSGALNWDAKINYNTNRATTVGTYCVGRVFTCMAAYNQYVARFVLNTIDNNSVCATYSDYTAMSTTLVPGGNYSISVTEAGPYKSYDKCWIWIDYNQNFLFDEDPIKLTGTPPNLSGTFTVPRNVRPGSTRLRVRLASDQDPIPCGNLNYGEVEDYTVNILSWLTLDNNFGTVAAGGTSTILVHLNAAKAEDGNPGIVGQNYVSELIFNSSPSAGTYTIPVTLAIIDPSLAAPENLSPVIINYDQGKLMVKWDYTADRDNLFDHFVVVRNGEPIVTRTYDFYIDRLTEPGTYCYKVYAVYSNGAYSAPSNEVCMDYPFPPSVPLANWALLAGGLLIVVYTFIRFRSRV